ncbi:MAG: NAD(P)-dependent oxidoreductase [Boseongicola sp.]|nr:NAD(P)-dependent oxidoreductase [Boseongicola sp.]
MEFLTEPFLVDAKTLAGPVLVTGAGGCIGAWTVSILHRSGVEVVACDLRDDRRRPGLFLGETRAARLNWATCDITELSALDELVRKYGVQSIIHLAGLQVPFCRANPSLGARVNVEGTINVLQVAREHNIRRLVYASSIAAYAMPPGGPYMATLYGAYKQAGEHAAQIYAMDWDVPSVGIRPNVVYGVARDQGMSSRCTVGIAKAVQGKAHDIPYTGTLSWLYAGEAAAAFIAAAGRDGDDAYVFDLNGQYETVERGLEILAEIVPGHNITASGVPMAMPLDLSDEPLREHVGDYPSVAVETGIELTYRAFLGLEAEGRLIAAV